MSSHQNRQSFGGQWPYLYLLCMVLRSVNLTRLINDKIMTNSTYSWAKNIRTWHSNKCAYHHRSCCWRTSTPPQLSTTITSSVRPFFDKQMGWYFSFLHGHAFRTQYLEFVQRPRVVKKKKQTEFKEPLRTSEFKLLTFRRSSKSIRREFFLFV